MFHDLLYKQTPVLTTRRLSKNARISCGGTGTVGWVNYRDLRAMDSHLNKTGLLPDSTPLLSELARNVQNSTCWGEGRKYKKLDCDVEIPYEGVPPYPQERNQQRKPVCAVVGNSGVLRYPPSYAKDIDSADVVIRFNHGVTQGYEKWVGSKSTFRMYNSPFVSPKQSKEVTFAQLREIGIRTWVKHMLRRPLGTELSFAVDPEFLCHAWSWVDKSHEKPSSGLVGMIFALRFCKHVHVYGFNFDGYFDSHVRPHYFDWERPKPGRENVHPFQAEQELYAALEAAGKLTMHRNHPRKTSATPSVNSAAAEEEMLQNAVNEAMARGA